MNILLLLVISPALAEWPYIDDPSDWGDDGVCTTVEGRRCAPKNTLLSVSIVRSWLCEVVSLIHMMERSA